MQLCEAKYRPWDERRKKGCGYARRHVPEKRKASLADNRAKNAALSAVSYTHLADGRCISLLKVLLSNCCVYDCKYCVNRVTNDVPRAAFTPRELADLTIGFYRRNYIEGLFLSSAVLRSPDYTMEQMIGVLELLRGEYRFRDVYKRQSLTS